MYGNANHGNMHGTTFPTEVLQEMKTNAQRRLNKNVKQSKSDTINTVCQDCSFI